MSAKKEVSENGADVEWTPEEIMVGDAILESTRSITGMYFAYVVFARVGEGHSSMFFFYNKLFFAQTPQLHLSGPQSRYKKKYNSSNQKPNLVVQKRN